MWSNLIGLCQLQPKNFFSGNQCAKSNRFFSITVCFLNLALKQINFKEQFLLYLW